MSTRPWPQKCVATLPTSARYIVQKLNIVFHIWCSNAYLAFSAKLILWYLRVYMSYRWTPVVMIELLYNCDGSTNLIMSHSSWRNIKSQLRMQSKRASHKHSTTKEISKLRNTIKFHRCPSYINCFMGYQTFLWQRPSREDIVITGYR